MRKKLIFGLVILTLFTQSVLGQDIKAVSKLDTNAMLIGDQVRLNIGISVPVNTLVGWPLIGDTILGHIRVLNRSKIDTIYSADKKSFRMTQSFLLTTFDSGYFAIPPVRFYVQQPPDTTKSVQQSEPAFLNVHSVHVDTTLAIKPIKGPVRVPVSFRELLPWIIGGILILALAGLFWYWLKKRKKAEPVFRLKPRIIIPPHEAALSALEKLRLKKLWQSGKIKEYHTELTEILRIYIEQSFDIMAMEMTSDEITDALADRTEISKVSLERLKRIFTMADLVKFAKALPLPSEHDHSLEEAVVFIREMYLHVIEPKEIKEISEPAIIN